MTTDSNLPPSPGARSSWRAPLLALSLAAVAVCNRGGQQKAAGPSGPVEVGVVTLEPTSVTLTRELPGRTSAFRVAEVRARVNGIVLKRLFTEGTDVTEGQVLYEIDPAPYQAALDSALGMLARAKANAATARTKEQR